MVKVLQKEVQAVREHLYCDCGGEMEWTGMCLTSYPGQYPHVCVECREEEVVSGDSYPKIVYVEINSDDTVRQDEVSPRPRRRSGRDWGGGDMSEHEALDLDELERVADAATGGEWFVPSRDCPDSVWTRIGESEDYVASTYTDLAAKEDAEHIATFDPPTVKRLIARLRELEKHTCCNNRNDKHAYDCARVQSYKASRKADRLIDQLAAKTKQVEAFREVVGLAIPFSRGRHDFQAALTRARALDAEADASEKGTE